MTKSNAQTSTRKSALAAAHCPPTLLFDEIDSGVGGRLGEVLGQKLSALAKERQIIVITHLPQIAARLMHAARCAPRPRRPAAGAALARRIPARNSPTSSARSRTKSRM